MATLRGLARNAITSATSAAVTRRPIETDSAKCAGGVRSVTVAPGCTTVTLMPCGPSSSARFLVNAETATLRMLPSVLPVCRAARPLTLTIRPQRCACMKGATARAQLQREIDVKVRGYLRCARAVAPLMVTQGWGRIVNVSGLAARQTGSVVGSVRNVAVAAMTKNLADELGPSGVNVTVVHPGPTVTDQRLSLIHI